MIKDDKVRIQISGEGTSCLWMGLEKLKKRKLDPDLIPTQR